MTVKDYQEDPPIKRPANVSESQWNQATELYRVAAKSGDKFPELTVAQAALETGWFKHNAGAYNYFGQKASAGQQGSVKNTQEVSNNQAYNTTAKFRDYNNLQEAVNDRVKKWSSKYNSASNIDGAISTIWQYNPKTGQGDRKSVV